MTSIGFLVWGLLAALAIALALLVAGEARRRAAIAGLASATAAADELRDEIWRLEAAAAARDRAEAASEAKGRFLATVSHEIRTPLAGIVGAADLLGSLDLGGEAASYVSAIKTSGAALASLIDEILDFSRIEAGRLELADVEFEPGPLVESVVELLAPRAHGKGLAIAALVSPHVPVRMRGDAARLRQILLNLAGNAIKFTASGGVGLRLTRETDGTLLFSVTDTGCGVPLNRQHAIFEEFEQADASPTRAHGGAGLGLAISRALAHRMGGALTLQTSAPTGSVFALALPCDAPARIETQAGAEAGTRVLVVGNAPFETEFLTERLASWSAMSACAPTETAARAILRVAPRFDVAIIDGAIGEEAAVLLAADAKAAGVGRALVLVSPFERRAIAPAAWRAFDGWLVKPVREASLRLCLVPHERAGTPRAQHDVPAPRLDGLHVLIAEDDDVNALIAAHLLDRQGARVTRVRDGAAAVAAVNSAGDIDAVLMDIRMPVLDGLAAARAIRVSEGERADPRLPLVALSANAFAEDRESALSAGFDLFLTKPVGLDTLARAIADVTRGHEFKKADAA